MSMSRPDQSAELRFVVMNTHLNPHYNCLIHVVGGCTRIGGSSGTYNSQ